ncbi:16S rRNA (guanine(966)-N(2))-methyltransferase RsmD [Tissierella sp. Yu-01]|uniref:16S rRNA (guanine(966)-N(2))-methyltransferase RsmD n=1 Tax=Tissierella sp. Yu-01 TaxID=3035694 RepID=UPI00240E2B95|nr:16S rRNA (guanine(966)-N(2))-methyltransferase RsmD [Tissierella sp. Yu-01]WFA09800.1 16S rRNA (guanine(966)-N(2))-methyltransferase RsmD [Tissierella sp. Yu-01]
MRVISGFKKGHRLKSPKGKDVRPTEDKIKESLFNILGPIKEESIVLDLFGGTGQIGIEFLSRGASKAYFVDIASTSISIIKENLTHTKLLDRSIIINKDALRSLRYLREINVKFDYIYLDPPFKEHELTLKTINEIIDYMLLSKDGIIIIEHEKEFILMDEYQSLIRFDVRNYGSKSLSFYRIGE